MKTLSTLCLIALALAGCASTKQDLPDSLYDQYASDLVGSRKCVVAGLLDADSASLAQAYTRRVLRSYNVDGARLDASTMKMRPWDANKEYCVDLAIKVAGYRRQIANNNAMVEADQRDIANAINNRPKQTYCNRIGTQVLCNSF